MQLYTVYRGYRTAHPPGSKAIKVLSSLSPPEVVITQLGSSRRPVFGTHTGWLTHHIKRFHRQHRQSLCHVRLVQIRLRAREHPHHSFVCVCVLHDLRQPFYRLYHSYRCIAFIYLTRDLAPDLHVSGLRTYNFFTIWMFSGRRRPTPIN